MCTFENEHCVLVCDVAISQVREAVRTAFGDVIQFTTASGAGTRVEVPPTVDGGAFQRVTSEAIASAQAEKNTTQSQ